MDDPWGSPWATSDSASQRNDPVPPPSPPRALLSPPPRALIGSISPALGQSPWVDDGYFRDLHGADLHQNRKSLTDWGTWGDSIIQQPQLTPRHDGSGRASPLAWPSSTANSPGLRPLPRSRTPSLFRQPSPDPWAVELSFRNRRDTSSTTYSLSLHEEAGAKTEYTSDPLTRPTRSGIGTETKEPNKNEVTSEDKIRTKSDKREHKRPHLPPVITTTRGSVESPTKPTLHNETQEVSPRPSSTFSHATGQEIDRQDSPITSIDEDSKTRPQVTSRGASRKDQGTAGKYDDSIKVTIPESPPATGLETPDSAASSLGSNKVAEKEGDAADFGDFEDAALEGGACGLGLVPASALSGRPSTPQGRNEDAVPRSPAPKTVELQSPRAKATSMAIATLIEKFGPIQFDVEPSAIDEIFPAIETPHDGNNEEHHIEVPDRIVTDSFASITERKAWYRISRHGSSRKHDSGEDENYHRITWSGSEVRCGTLKTVRRWMEEDSYTGRAVLGGSKRTNVFNWDSDAAPVDLNAVFGRKSSLHSRASSVQQRHSATSSIHSIAPPSMSAAASRASISSLATSEVPSTPVAGFGWSSGIISESPEIVVPASVKTGKSRQSFELPPPPSSLPSTPALGARKKVPSHIKLPAQPQIDDIADDEDDDWGEMVSSPQIATHPSIDQVVSLPPETSPQQPQEDPPSAVLNTMSPAPAADPWVFTDFSVFEPPAQSAASPVVGQQLKPSPMMPSEPKPQPHSSVNMSAPDGSGATAVARPSISSPTKKTEAPVSAPAPAPAPALAPNVVKLGPIEETGSSRRSNEREQDETVRRIVQGLPDLSYMLRKGAA